MIHPSRWSIRAKLTGISLAVCSCALLVTSVGYGFLEYQDQRHALVREISVLVNAVASNCAADLVFDGRDEATETLASLRAAEELREAVLVDRSGEVFARFARNAPDRPGWFRDLDPGHRFVDEGLDLTARVEADGEVVGTLHVHAGLDQIWARIWRISRTFGALLVAAIGIAAVASGRLQRMISGPLGELVDVARAVAQTRDFAIRAQRRGDDETGKLVDAINGMVESLGDQDRELRQHRENLEGEIAEQTRRLRDQNAELVVARDRAEAGAKAKAEFLATMSHEIRTPMNAVLGMSDLVLDSDLNTEQRDQLETARDSAESLLTIIDDILDFSKVEAGKLQLADVPFSLRDLVSASLKPLAFQADGKGLSLTAEVADDVADVRRGDPGRVRQVLTNLIGNALKFTDRGRIEVRVQNGEAPAALRLEVADTGVGISPDKLERIFEAFVQTDSTFTRQAGGTGLGLAITAQIVELMNGKLTVESELGAGSVFRCEIELRLGTEGDRQEVAGRAESAEARPGTNHKLRVLLTEDNPVNQKLAKQMLTKAGHEVVVAENGQECLDVLAGQTFDLVLMDVMMPVMDGLAATRAIRLREEGGGARLPVVAVTANAMQGDREACLEAGMDDYLAKPIRKRDLLRTLERVCQRFEIRCRHAEECGGAEGGPMRPGCESGA